MNRAKRSKAPVAAVLSIVSLQQHIPRPVARASIDIENDHAIAYKILLKALLDGFDGSIHRGGIVVRRYADKQIDFADTHQLAEKVVFEKSFLSQVAPSSKLKGSVAAWNRLSLEKND